MSWVRWLWDAAARHPRAAVLSVIIGSAVLRVIYAVLVMDPVGSGPDGPSYHEAAVAMEAEWFLASVPAVPYWPAGYPMVIAAVYSVVGVLPQAVTVLQIVAVAAAVYYFYLWVTREFGWEVGLLTVLLLTVSPAFGASQTVLMYEPLLAISLMLAVPLFASRADVNHHGLRMLAGAALLAFGAALQPRMVAAGVLMIGRWAWRWRRWGAVVLAVGVLALGPLSLMARNYVAEGHAVMSAHLGPALSLGVDANLACAPYDGMYERDRVLTRCAIEWTLENPREAAVQAGDRAVDYWRPFVGPFRDGTWFHAFDPRRPVPDVILDSPNVERTDVGLSIAWMVGLVSLLVWGGRRAWQANRVMTIFLLLPVLAFFAVSVAIIGDARMRLPTAPLYSVLLACVIAGRQRREAMGSPPGEAAG